MDLQNWKNLKRSGAYRRKVKKRYEAMIPSHSLLSAASSSRADVKKNVEGSTELFLQNSMNNSFDEDFSTDYQNQSDNESLDENDSAINRDIEKDEFRNDIAVWALEYNITHCALNKLFKIVNKIVPYSLPTDARTLLKSNRVIIKIVEIDNGHYWHNGLIEQLTLYLQRQSEIPTKVSLNINIDGLPVYKSSNQQFWPILCNVSEIKEMSPLVIGIYEGKTKPLNLDTYFQSFISEVKQLETGLKIIDKTGVVKIIEVKIRAFICDSPARALIKDNEDYIVYNILEEAEDLIFDKDNDPLLCLTPIVYTTKLDEMKTIKEDLKNLKANEILRKLDSESRPIIMTENIQRSSLVQNLQSFMELSNIVDRINLKADHQVSSPQMSLTPNASLASKKENIRNTIDYENEVAIDENSRIVSNVNFELNREKPLYAGIVPLSGAYVAFKQEPIDLPIESNFIRPLDEIGIVSNNMHHKEKPQIHPNSDHHLSSNAEINIVNQLSLNSDHHVIPNIEISVIPNVSFTNKKEYSKNTIQYENEIALGENTSAVSNTHLGADQDITLTPGTLPSSDCHFVYKQEPIEVPIESNFMMPFSGIGSVKIDTSFKEKPQEHIDLHSESTSVVSDMHFRETAQIPSSYTISTNCGAYSCMDFNSYKEFIPCHVVLRDIKKLIPANRPVKLDSNDRIINKVQVKEETKETQIQDLRNLEIPISSKIILGQKQNSNDITSIRESNRRVPIALDSISNESQNRSKEASILGENPVEDLQTSYSRPKRKRKRRIFYDVDNDTTSDEDYTPTIETSKKSKTRKVFSHRDSTDSMSSNASSNSVLKKIRNNNVKTVSVQKTSQNNVSKTSQNNVLKTGEKTDSKPVQNNVSKPVPNNVSKPVQNITPSSNNNVPNATNVIIVSNDMCLASFQEKYALIVLMSAQNKASVYRVNNSKLVTDFYVTKEYGEYKLASLYPKEEKIIEQYCCFYKREEIITKICARKNYPYTILKYLKEPHTCHPEECHCCCQVMNTDTSQSKLTEKRAVVNKCVSESDTWVRGLLEKSDPSPDGLVGKALTYTPTIIKRNPEEKKSEKYLENYLLCLKHNSPNIAYELYEIGQNGNVVQSLSLRKEEEVLRIRKKYQVMSMPIRDAELCCWYRREKLMYELKMLKTSPAALKHIQKSHSCNYQKCLCCCKPLPVTLIGVEILPSVFKHTTAYEKYLRPLSIHFSAKSKNAMLKANESYEKSKKIKKNTGASTAAVVLSGCASKDDNPNLSNDILSKFKNLKFGVDSYGKLEVVLSEPAKNLSIVELKRLSEILTLSSKKKDELSLSAEEFCKRISSKSGEIIHITTAPETSVISTEEVTPSPLQDHYEDDEITGHAQENVNVQDDMIMISSDENTTTSGTDNISSSSSLNQTGFIEQRKITTKIPSLKTKNLKSASNFFASLASSMETKTKCYVDSFKSFFNKSEVSDFVLPNTNKFTPIFKAAIEQAPLTLPIIKETFTLAKSPIESDIAIPGPSGVTRQHGVIPFNEKINKLQASSQNQIPNTSFQNYKRKIEITVDTQIEKKIRIKPPSELNAPILEAQSVIDHLQLRPKPIWPAPVATKQESQINIQQNVTPESTPITMRIVSPSSVSMNKVIRCQPIKVSSQTATNVSGLHYITIGSLMGSNSVDASTKPTLAQILQAPQAPPTVTSSGRCHVPPLVPIRASHSISSSVESNVNEDLEKSISFNVIKTSK